ncbi:fasciclin domain-containing protein [Rufibacter sp. LB8]|uniref:fasciclin domain-containing protein n=1 Tax=Rufibacter sp. LB8 TaxID=2777781 RepID=UPI00178C4359|nr:fasciclin domain-containing protein [Rufibacter sp. LB8]
MRKFNYIKIIVALAVMLWLPFMMQAQSFLAAGAATTSKTARMSMGEGLAANNQQLLLDLVTKAGLMPLLSSGDTYTFFVPSAQALTAYQDAAPDKLRSFFSKHIIAGALTTADLRDGSDLKTIDGSKLRICKKKGATIVAGVRLQQEDQLFANGVIHQLKGAFQLTATTL